MNHSDYNKRKYEQFAHWIVESNDAEFDSWYEGAHENQRSFADRILDEEEENNEE